jgi:hypothetical protein
MGRIYNPRNSPFGESFVDDAVDNFGRIITPKQAKARNADTSYIDDALTKYEAKPGSSLAPVGSPSVGSRAANFLWGAEDWGKAARAASRGDVGSAAGSAAWGALALGSTIGSFFVGPGAKAAGVAAQTARAVKAAEGVSTASKLGKGVKNIGGQAAIYGATSVVGNKLVQAFDKPDATTTGTTGSGSGGGGGNTKLRGDTESAGFNSGMQFAKVPKVF